jgi:hypothetical protein
MIINDVSCVVSKKMPQFEVSQSKKTTLAETKAKTKAMTHLQIRLHLRLSYYFILQATGAFTMKFLTAIAIFVT